MVCMYLQLVPPQQRAAEPGVEQHPRVGVGAGADHPARAASRRRRVDVPRAQPARRAAQGRAAHRSVAAGRQRATAITGHISVILHFSAHF